MRINKYLALFVLLLVITLSESGCSYKGGKAIIQESGSAKYVNVFGDSLLAIKLGEISKSVRKVNCYADYRTYIFYENSKMVKSGLSDEAIFSKAMASISSNEAVSGTATVIYSDSTHIALLTCAHIVNFPDTVISYFEGSDLASNKYIQSISVKEKQQVFVRGLPDGGSIDVFLSDTPSDIAILGKVYDTPKTKVPVMSAKVGKSTLLEWGSYLYLLGYPLGQQMITGGMASKPVAPGEQFIVDALFNEGFSGGLVMAISSCNQDPEFIGFGRSVSARSEYILKPEKENYEFSYNPKIPYKGEAFVRLRKDINYGITYVVPVEKVFDFYQKNRPVLIQKGIDLDSFFER
ncbi:MAG: serine protease [Bacteroidota bacterium]